MAKKRTFDVLRDRILKSFKSKAKTVNQLAKDSGINWKTVDNHLIFLVGKGMVSIVFESPYVKIYELSDRGKEYLEKLR